MNQHIKNNLPTDTATTLPNLAKNLGIGKLESKIYALYGLEKSEDIDLLIALFVEYLADNLELIQKPAEIGNSNLVALTCFPSLPSNFPENADIPMYLYGDKVCVCREAIEDYDVQNFKCREADLNCRHEDFQSSALPPELSWLAFDCA